jgi:hypothetical protein
MGAGDSFTVDRDGLTLVHALELARVPLEQPVPAGKPASLFRAPWRYRQSRRADDSGRDTTVGRAFWPPAGLGIGLNARPTASPAPRAA